MGHIRACPLKDTHEYVTNNKSRKQQVQLDMEGAWQLAVIHWAQALHWARGPAAGAPPHWAVVLGVQLQGCFRAFWNWKKARNASYFAGQFDRCNARGAANAECCLSQSVRASATEKAGRRGSLAFQSRTGDGLC